LTGIVSNGRAVDVAAARALDGFEICVGRHVFRRLEHHVFEQMCEAGTADLLIGRADVVPQIHGDQRQPVILRQDHIEPVWQRVLLKINFGQVVCGCGSSGSLSNSRRVAGDSERQQQRRRQSHQRTNEAIRCHKTSPLNLQTILLFGLERQEGPPPRPKPRRSSSNVAAKEGGAGRQATSNGSLLLTINMRSDMLLLSSNKREGKLDETPSEVQYGTLDLMVLKTLDAMGPLHGYGIARRIEQVAEGSLALNQGTIYPALVRLESKGWISSDWGTSENNRRARFYAITRAGKKQLAAEAESWARTVAIVNRLLEGRS
jgi:PadR family transcriptional regulator PadR